MENSTPYIFSDVDGTLINIKSMFSFLTFFKKRIGFNESSDKHLFLENCDKFNTLLRIGAKREDVNRAYYRQFAGVKENVFNDIAGNWASIQKSRMQELLITPVIDEINQIRSSFNAKLVFVSGSFPQILAPFMEHLDADDYLATKIISHDGQLTGEIDHPQTIGDGKAVSIQMFLQKRGISPEICMAYGDHSSDIPMLKCVGDAVAVIGDAHLKKIAIAESWKTIDISHIENSDVSALNI